MASQGCATPSGLGLGPAGQRPRGPSRRGPAQWARDASAPKNFRMLYPRCALRSRLSLDGRRVTVPLPPPRVARPRRFLYLLRPAPVCGQPRSAASPGLRPAPVCGQPRSANVVWSANVPRSAASPDPRLAPIRGQPRSADVAVATCLRVRPTGGRALRSVKTQTDSDGQGRDEGFPPRRSAPPGGRDST
jgi:hypothetical protein